MKKLFLTLNDKNGNEIFSDFIEHIDACKHNTIGTHKLPCEANVIRIPFVMDHILVLRDILCIYYENGLFAEITRK